MNHASLFSGIGGFDLAAEWMGWNNVLSCEIDPFCNRVLKYHFPNAIHYEDIRKTDFTIHRGQIDIITGGFPCQPFSMAGKRRGTDDDRHLWPEMLRAIREIQPRWVVGENVFGFTNWSGGMVFEQVLSDLENEGFEAQPFILPAAAVNAPHRRDRVWIVAHRKEDGREGEFKQWQGNGLQEWCLHKHKAKGRDDIRPEFERFGQNGDAADTEETELQCTGQTRAGWDGFADGFIADTGRGQRKDGIYGNKSERQTGEPGDGRPQPVTRWHNFPTQPPLRSRNDGFPGRLDGITVSKLRNESIKAYGNAIVPQVAYEIFKAINQYEHNDTN